MARRSKLVLGLVATLLAMPILAFLVADAIAFQPRKDDIHAIVTSADPEDRVPPRHVEALLAVALHGDMATYCTRLVIGGLGIESDHARRGWAPRFALWQAFVRLHLSEAERRAIILSLAPTGRSRVGVAATSRALYALPPSKLTVEEAATVIALIVTPTAEDDAALLATLRNVLLMRYATQG